MEYIIKTVEKGTSLGPNEVLPTLWTEVLPEDEHIFKEAARRSYIAGAPVNVLWHPLYLYECYLINKEAQILKVWKQEDL